MTDHEIRPGFIVLHSHRLEHLRDVLVHWLRAYPLGPLENEVVLVQSNGMAQWLKAALAADAEPARAGQPAGLGICAALEVVFPARFLWRAYRDVLGHEAVPATSPLDKQPLLWRLLRELPAWLDEPVHAPLRRFLQDDADGRKAWQLAQQIADLFDQYQVYRPDWLADWAAGDDRLRGDPARAVSEPQPVPGRERWQPALWRALLDSLARDGLATDGHRAALHQQFLAALAAADRRPRQLPRRVIVWGLSALPRHVLEALAALGRHCQVIVAMVNPCQFYWTDLLQPRPRRHGLRPGLPPVLAEHSLRDHANPLLLAWGQQGRDTLAMLADYDDADSYRARFQGLGQRIDLFDAEPADTLLTQLQAAVRELQPLPSTPAGRLPVAAGDDSLHCHVAHSRLREVEALHDYLLRRFDAAREAGQPLHPQDVAVMVPDIRDYAPLVQAVFGADPDTRLPFALLDRPVSDQAPMLRALTWLLGLPDARCTLLELWAVLDVPAIHARFGLAASDLPLLRRWFEQAGARWGLDPAHRRAWGMRESLTANTWAFALDRLLLGYAAGDADAFSGVWPEADFSPLDAAVLGPMAQFLQKLSDMAAQLQSERPVAEWAVIFRALLDDFLAPETPEDLRLLARLQEELANWQTLAGAELRLSRSVAVDAWLERLEEGGMSQRFLTGCIHVATLMPMRAIPFRVVCLLGLNDGEFPRQRPPVDFDLMALAPRAGDRSRRQDDRYLFLEALLSARDHVLLSWVGRSARNNQEQPPSLLVGQWRDYVLQAWRCADTDPDDDSPAAQKRLWQQLHTELPLQPFSARYFLPGTSLQTFSRSWRDALDPLPAEVPAVSERRLPEMPVTAADLLRWWRDPVASFWHHRLDVRWPRADEQTPEHEPFVLDGLPRYSIQDELLQALLLPDPEPVWQQILQRRAGSGQWPLSGFGELASQALDEQAARLRQAAETLRQSEPVVQRTRQVTLTVADCPVTIELPPPLIRRGPDGELTLWGLTGSRVHDSKGGVTKFAALMPFWLDQVLLAQSGQSLPCAVLSGSGLLRWPALPSPLANQWCRDVVAAWLVGQAEPLPLPRDAALAFARKAMPSARSRGEAAVNVDKAMAAAAAVYDGEDRAARPPAPPMIWAYPDFAAVSACGRFQQVAEQLYLPMVNWILSAQGDSDD